MASIRKEMKLAAPPDAVWAAVRDVGAIHTRLAPDFVGVLHTLPHRRVECRPP